MTGTQRKRRKPRGSHGTSKLGADGAVRFVPAELPDTKEEIEQVVIKAFDRVLDRSTRQRFGITGFTKTADESDLDCMVHSSNADFRMELTELVKDDISRGGYDNALARRLVGEGADRILLQIRAKSDHYATRGHSWLLIYPTAWQFGVTPLELAVVRDSLLRKPPRFSRIYLLEYPAEVDPFLTLIYPVSLSEFLRIKRADMRSLRMSVAGLIDPRRISVQGLPEGANFQVRV